jgi:hypothetical protein
LILYLSGPCVLPASCVFITSTSIWRAVKTPCVCLECGLYLSVSESVHYLWVSETYLSLSGMFVSVSASLWLCQRPSSSWYVSFISVCLSIWDWASIWSQLQPAYPWPRALALSSG